MSTDTYFDFYGDPTRSESGTEESRGSDDPDILRERIAELESEMVRFSESQLKEELLAVESHNADQAALGEARERIADLEGRLARLSSPQTVNAVKLQGAETLAEQVLADEEANGMSGVFSASLRDAVRMALHKVRKQLTAGAK